MITWKTKLPNVQQVNACGTNELPDQTILIFANTKHDINWTLQLKRTLAQDLDTFFVQHKEILLHSL